MEDGVPVYPTMHTFFINADNLFRPDENIERVGIIRGGSSSLFGSNTPEVIINFINKDRRS
jgi:outer membrane receptor protein involved in Fe transport